MAIDSNYFNIENDGMNLNKIEDILVEGEEILVHLVPNKKVYILESIFKGLPVAAFWAAIDVFILITMANVGFFDGGGIAVFFVIGFFAIHLIPVWLFIANIVKRVMGWKNVKYVFTDRRIIIRSGIIGIDFKSLYYIDINGVVTKVGIFDRIFKVGDLHIKTATQSAVVEDIVHPYEYASRIEKIIVDLKADMNFPNGLRPETNPGYNTTYNPQKPEKK